MPGRRLNDDERDLKRFWDQPPQQFQKPLLRHVSIAGPPGLRGIESLIVQFSFPFTAICGRNGVGKSTVLALAAVSAKSPDGWRVFWGNSRPSTGKKTRAEYKFSDFFLRRSGDPSRSGLTLGWAYAHLGNEIERREIHNGKRFARMVDEGRNKPSPKPEREIDFIPVARVLPANEHAGVRSAFKSPSGGTVTALDAHHLAILSHVMGRPYQEAHTRAARGLTLPGCRANAAYSGFDMGAGEASLVTILSRLQALPTGGLLLIEELELGLHPEAQARLVENLVRECRRRRIQIICTTHSDIVLDRLPRIARILLRRDGGDHDAITGVSTRFALHQMGGDARPELQIYTEDKFAAMIVEEALPPDIRPRLRVSDIGNKTALARQAVSHARGEADLGALSLFDGDCTTTEIDGWIASERGERAEINPEYLTLPGNGNPPERWILAELGVDPYLGELAGALGCTAGSAKDHVDDMAAQVEHHSTAWILSRRTGISEQDAARKLARSVRDHPGLDIVREKVANLLDG